MAKVIVHGSMLWTAITRFLDKGRLKIDNRIVGRSERGIQLCRGTTFGRYNLRLAGFLIDGKRVTFMCIHTEACKMNGIDPRADLAAVIPKIANDWPMRCWNGFMPCNR